MNKSLDSNELKFIIDAPAERDDFNAHNLVRLLTTAGQQFIREAQFGEKADASVLHIVLPLIGSEDGRRWLLDHLAEANQWVAGSEVSTRVTLAEQLVSQRGSGEAYGENAGCHRSC